MNIILVFAAKVFLITIPYVVTMLTDLAKFMFLIT